MVIILGIIATLLFNGIITYLYFKFLINIDKNSSYSI